MVFWVYRPQWLNALRGYSTDMDSSIDNINDQYETALNNICTKMKEKWNIAVKRKTKRVVV